MRRINVLVLIIIIVATILTSCAGPTPKDLLSQIKSRGYVLVSTDTNFAPQSSLNPQGKRPSNTKCPPGTYTTAEMQGFDVDVAAEIGKRLGVETCFTNPSWNMIIAGSWADKWDLSVGSVTITNTRAKVLNFTVPYYYDNVVIAVIKDSGINTLADLSGKALCAGGLTVCEDWLNGNLDLPAADLFAQPPANVKEVQLGSDLECAQAIYSGRTDFIGYVTTDIAVDANIAAGFPVIQLDGPVFLDRLAAAVDKSSSIPTDTFIAKLNTIITAMHSDGTLTNFSMKWYKADLTRAPK